MYCTPRVSHTLVVLLISWWAPCVCVAPQTWDFQYQSPLLQYSSMTQRNDAAYFFGGGPNQVSNSLYMFEFSTSLTYGPLQPTVGIMPTARIGHTLVGRNTNLLLFGGRSATNLVFNDLYYYNTGENKWYGPIVASMGAPPTPRFFHSAVLRDSTMIVFGGALSTTSRAYSNEVFFYDIFSFSWTSVTTSGGPSPRCGHSAAIWNGTMVVYGGLDVSPNELWLFSVVEQRWSRVDIPLANTYKSRSFHTSIFIKDSRLLIIGGNATNLNGQQDPAPYSLEWYMPRLDKGWRYVTFSSGADGPSLMGGVNAVNANGTVLLFGTSRLSARGIGAVWRVRTLDWIPTMTPTLSPIPTRTRTPVPTISSSPTGTATAWRSQTATATPTATPTSSSTSTPTARLTPPSTLTPLPTVTPTPIASLSSPDTNSQTRTFSPSGSVTRRVGQRPTATATPTPPRRIVIWVPPLGALPIASPQRAQDPLLPIGNLNNQQSIPKDSVDCSPFRTAGIAFIALVAGGALLLHAISTPLNLPAHLPVHGAFRTLSLLYAVQLYAMLTSALARPAEGVSMTCLGDFGGPLQWALLEVPFPELSPEAASQSVYVRLIIFGILSIFFGFLYVLTIAFARGRNGMHPCFADSCGTLSIFVLFFSLNGIVSGCAAVAAGQNSAAGVAVAGLVLALVCITLLVYVARGVRSGLHGEGESLFVPFDELTKSLNQSIANISLNQTMNQSNIQSTIESEYRPHGCHKLSLPIGRWDVRAPTLRLQAGTSPLFKLLFACTNPRGLYLPLVVSSAYIITAASLGASQGNRAIPPIVPHAVSAALQLAITVYVLLAKPLLCVTDNMVYVVHHFTLTVVGALFTARAAGAALPEGVCVAVMWAGALGVLASHAIHIAVGRMETYSLSRSCIDFDGLQKGDIEYGKEGVELTFSPKDFRGRDMQSDDQGDSDADRSVVVAEEPLNEDDFAKKLNFDDRHTYNFEDHFRTDSDYSRVGQGGKSPPVSRTLGSREARAAEYRGYPQQLVDQRVKSTDPICPPARPPSSTGQLTAHTLHRGAHPTTSTTHSTPALQFSTTPKSPIITTPQYGSLQQYRTANSAPFQYNGFYIKYTIQDKDSPTSNVHSAREMPYSQSPAVPATQYIQPPIAPIKPFSTNGGRERDTIPIAHSKPPNLVTAPLHELKTSRARDYRCD